MSPLAPVSSRAEAPTGRPTDGGVAGAPSPSDKPLRVAASCAGAAPAAVLPPQDGTELQTGVAQLGISVSDLERGRTVGLGSYGKVVLVRHATSGMPFALKCLNRRLVVQNGQQRCVARERLLMASISHPLCVRLVASFKDAHSVYLLLEWCPGGELLRYVPQQGGMPEPSARFYGGCVCLALEHLHGQGIVYRDLKPENLLLDGQGYLKLCDFGFAKRLGASGVTHTVCGTPDFMAPEIIRGKGAGRVADMWSLGVLLYELVTGRPPFAPRGSPPAAVYAAVLSGTPAPALDMSAPLTALLQGLIQACAPSLLAHSCRTTGWHC